MKSVKNILPIILIIFAILACTLPSSIDIKWSPELTIPSVSDFGSMFKSYFMDYIKSSEESLTIIPCVNDKPDMAFVLNMLIVGQDTDKTLSDCMVEYGEIIAAGYSLPGDVKNITDSMWAASGAITDERLLFGIEDSDDPVSMSMADLVEVLDGFLFSTIEARLYTGGSDIIDSLRIEIKIESNNTLINEISLMPEIKRL